ncbi:nonribosomal peptide synthase [Aspergillus sclerotiicarbonarius CBS 121057]|uniref:Malformin synthetase mlfA n=1 Tax=Aspergillus sclerotiicarbonarius (strain CBS 121057 / IBT 28362) TaxID=1448318 RepID=MLFA_ASPSB|nr:RecName: Full=Malformin synthetase mlfA; AltName: Full=Malformin biosynthesis cluster protein A; AltName: Full=Nonribosomal peptide synthetase mlfA [Aspergillus sclerotiicarbonarius CBS 121057]PYI01631.1 nonribosomal peptide synthase [Aspergillus sclerotiicarbonarius CBS 121057]
MGRFSCIFPSLTDGYIPDPAHCRAAGRRVYEIDLGGWGPLPDRPDAHLVAAWALILSSYVGTDEVAFYVVPARGPDATALCELKVNGSLPRRSLTDDAWQLLHPLPLGPGQVSSETANTIITFAEDIDPLFITQAEEAFLTLHVRNTSPGNVALHLGYHLSLFTDAQAANVGTAMAQVLTSLAGDPDELVRDVDHMSRTHLDQIWHFNANVPSTWQECFHDVVQRHAADRPHSLAIDAWDGRLTYAELVGKATPLARHMQERGVRPGVVVPISFERSAGALIAMLAVSKAGGAFVSVPTSLPPGRLDAILEVIEAPFVLTRSTHQSFWAGRLPALIIDNYPKPASTAVVETLAKADDLFYVIFTSGSTGRPKGCMLSHSNWLNGALRNAPNWKYGPNSRVLQMLNHTFDMSLLEICTSLGSGACVCIPPADEVEAGLAGAINRWQVNHVIMTPSLARALRPGDVPGLRTMCLGGEAFPREIVTMWSECIHLFQFYGPSECSINSSTRAITGVDADPLNIGPPNSAACWVSDIQDHNKLVPIGAIGELLVSGPIVGMGYLRNPVKTAEAFIDHVGFIPMDDPKFAGFRLYKTGDLVRWNSDGTLTFCGRADTQVKLNGQRLELAEVEYQLGLEADVQLAIALVPQVGRCKNNLIAILTVRGAATSSRGVTAGEIPLLNRQDPIVQQAVKRLRAQLQQALPRYMVPTIWAFVGHMPMSASGKIDRVRVRGWVEEMSQETFDAITGRSFEADDHLLGLTHLENEIQLAWAEALGLSAAEVGLHQPFVALGGDSIKALDAVGRCRARQVDITMVSTLSCEGVREAASLAKVRDSPTQRVVEMAVDYSDLWDCLSSDYDLAKLGIGNADEVEDVFPCTSMQEGMFLGQIRRPGAYHMRFFHRVQLKGGGLPTVERIQTAWSSLVARHPSLRTIFVDDLSPEAIYHSVVLRNVPVDTTTREVPRDLSPEDALSMFTQELVPFRPNAPLHRLRLFTCRGRVSYFMLEISHVIMDGYALSVFRREFIQACSTPASVPRGPDYRMFANYHRTRQTADSAAYWTAYLKDAAPCHIPTYDQAMAADGLDYPRTLLRRDFSYQTSGTFLQRCKERQVTLACAIRATWALVLRAYTQSQDVCFGYVSSGRNVPVPDVETIFGLCLSMQVCRARVGESRTLVDLARRIQEDYVESLPYQHYPLAEVQRGLKQTRRQALFNTAISMEWVPPAGDDEDALIDLEEIREQDDPTEYDIAISVDVHAGCIKLGFLYWPTLTEFEITHLAQAMQGAMDCFALQPDGPVDSLTLLKPGDLSSALVGWPDLLPLEAVRGNVMSMIDRWVNRQPDTLAIDGWDESLTYHQLQQQSSWVARNLLHRGVHQGDRILVCMDRSSRTVVTILGIVRSGAVLVLSNPADPAKRLQWLTQKCNAAMIVADPQYRDRFEAPGNPSVTVVDAPSVCTPAAWDYLFPVLDGQDPVSILFTSGSTGTPKGIVMHHGSLATSVLLGHGRTLRFSRQTRMLHFASLTFDAALAEIFTTLAHGGCMCIPSEDDRLSDVPGCIARFKVNTAMLTPSVGRILDPAALPTLRTLVLVGEPMSRLDVERFAPALDLYNGAGPTETSIMVTIAGPMQPTDDPLNLGHAVAGVRLWVTETEAPNRLAPLGAVGELVVEGSLVTQGYLDDPVRTQEAFLSKLAWLPSHNPLYRTGDLVRYVADGSFRYMGRKDTQVKLRGQRIELQEVEYHLRCSWPHAQVVVEMVIPDGRTRSQAALVAFVSGLTPEDAHFLFNGALISAEAPGIAQAVLSEKTTQALSEALPRHMVPSIYLALETIPLSVNGKADRRRLRDLGASWLASSAFHPGPECLQTPTAEWARAPELERTLVELWATTLSIEPGAIRGDDSFFELGGDSVSAMKLVATARDKYKLSLSVPQVFRYPTIRQIATQCEGIAVQLASSASSTTEEGFTFSTPDESSTNEGLDGEFWQLASAQLADLAREKGKTLDVAAILKRMQQESSSSPAPSVSSSSSSSSAPKPLLAQPEPPTNLRDSVPEPFSLIGGGPSAVEQICQQAMEQCQIPRESIEDIYPATPLQEGMMALMAKTPGVYTTTLRCELSNQVDCARLQSAWDQASEAHPILRTRIVLTNDHRAMQVVQHGNRLPWDVYSLRDSDNLPDLTSQMTLGSPLLRLAEIRQAGGQGRLLLVTIHHALYDGWSFPLVKQAVEDAYSGQALKSQAFTPFIAYLNEGRLAAEQFWADHLESFAGGAFPCLPTVDHRIRPTARLTRKLSLPVSAGHQYTLATKIQAAWAVTVSRYDDETDVVFGTVSTGRAAPVPGIDRVAGPTITTIPVRVSLQDRAQRVGPFLQKVQEDGWRSLDHEHLGLQHIRRLGDSAAAACRLQTLLVLQPRQQPPAEPSSAILAGLQDMAELEGLDTYPLMLVCEPDGADVHLIAIFDPVVLHEAILARMVTHWEHVLTQLWTEPDIAVVDLEALSPGDKKVLMRWNGASQLPDGCVHESVHQWRLSTPHAPAVCAWDGDWTYEELDNLSSALAHHLTLHGVSHGTSVALYHEKSRWAAVGLLAVFKAGGILVTLDPAHPVDRLREILGQVQARVILSSQEHEATAKALGTLVLTVEEVATQPEPELFRPVGPITSSQCAFTPFTSGSTGRPKGIPLEHRGMVATIASMAERCLLTTTSRVLQFASFAFDASVMEHLLAWYAGGCLCVPSEFDRQANLGEVIRDLRVNWAFLTPSCLRLITPDDVPCLEGMGLGGEPVLPEHITTWAPRLRQLVQMYGPAECSFVTVLTEVTQASENRLIGSPSACRCWVIDPMDPDRLMPLGAIGELVIEGLAVGRGYINEPQRTAEAFIAPPPWLQTLYPDDGQPRRLYRTGDLVRYAGDDGRLTFVGRKDGQLKLHGQRIELGDVETHLRPLIPATQGIAVEMIVCADDQNPLLAAFIEVSQDATALQRNTHLVHPGRVQSAVDIKAIESTLARTVPHYMVPSIYLHISKLPLNPSGKLNRRQLREMVGALPRQSLNEYAIKCHSSTTNRPATAQERGLQTIWATVLALDRDAIGVHDDFFRMGGDSIAGMQVATKCNAAGMRISSADLFRHRTIARLVLHLQNTSQESSAMITLPEEKFDEWVHLAPIQQLFFENAPDGPNHFNQSLLLRTGRQVDAQELAAGLDILVQRHSMLRARFRRTDSGRWTQQVMSLGPSPSSFYRLFTHGKASPETLPGIFTASQSAIDIQKGPLLSVDLVDLTDGSQLVYFVAHHLVIDLVSWRILHAELEDYLRTGSLAAMAESTPFLTWCRAQAEYSAKELSPAQSLPGYQSAANHFDPEGYWGISMESNTFTQVASYRFTLDGDTTETLFGVANDALGTQPVEIMLAALWYSFTQTLTGRPEPSIYVEGHGREPWTDTIDLSGTVGWFTTMSPLVSSPWSNLSQASMRDFADALRYIKDQRRRVPANGWAYFASRYLNDEGRVVYGRTNPAVEILFNYMGQYQQLTREDAILQLVGDDIQAGTGAADIAGDVRRFALIDVSAFTAHGCLSFDFSFPESIQHRDRLQHWFEQCRQTLIVAASILSLQTPQKTLTDFPLLPSLTYDQLSQCLDHTLPAVGLFPSDIVDIYPCSPVQRGMLLAQLRNPQFYQQRFRFRVLPDTRTEAIGLVGLQQVRDAWIEVINRHDILRTIFLPVSDQGYVDQVLLKPGSLHHLVRIGAGEPDTAIDPGTPHWVNISHDPTGTVVCDWNVSHALVDAVSVAIIQREVSQALQGHLSTPPPQQYGNYIQWLSAQNMQETQDYWKKYLQAVEPCLFPRLAAHSDRLTSPVGIQATRATVDREVRIDQLCHQHGITLTNVFHLVWALVLRTYVGTNNVCFGYATQGRDVPVAGVEEMVGPVVNVLATTLRLQDSESVLDALQTHQTHLADNLAHQNHALVDIYATHGVAGSQLFNTIVSLQDLSHHETADTQSLRLEVMPAHDSSEYDIALNVGVNKTSIELVCSYQTWSLSAEHADALLRTAARVLDEILQTPLKTIGEVDVVSLTCKQQAMRWNATLPATVHEYVHEQIQAQCRLYANREAVCAWDGHFTFAEIDDLSSRLAGNLISLGAQPGRIVPIYSPKSRWVVIAILGVLKAGAAFTLLDASHPVARLQEICQGVNADLIISLASHASVAAQLAAAIVILDNAPSMSSDEIIMCTRRQSLSTESLAYVIFTSGSTGKPKGVMVSHSNLCTSAMAQTVALNLTTESRVLQFASYAFDACILEVIGALFAGACVCIPSETDSKDDLVGSIERMRVTWALLTPSVARILNQETLPTLETLVLGGEPITLSDLEPWRSRLQLVCAYGPSECTIVSTTTALSTFPNRSKNIGQRGACATWVVDPQDYQKLVPFGATGELLIEGPIVGQGYLGDAVRTAECFPPPPRWLSQLRQAPTRVYRTGDLVRYESDGTIRFVGRKDSQIKFHGQRIELGDIEHHAQDAFRDAQTVIIDLITPGELHKAYLAAFVLQKDTDAHLDKVDDDCILLSPSDRFRSRSLAAQEQMHEELPHYMVPAIFLPLSRVPLAKTGKTDRQYLRQCALALQGHDLEAYRAASSTKRPPSTGMQQGIQALVATVLGKDTTEVGMDDSFFHLGGDSVQAMRLVSVGRQQGLAVSVLSIFDHPRLADLAEHISSRVKDRNSVRLPSSSLLPSISEAGQLDRLVEGHPFEKDDVVDILPTTGFQRYWLDMQLSSYVIIDIPGQVDWAQLTKALQRVIENCPILRTAFVPYRGSTVQVILKTIVSLIEVDLTGDLTSAVEEWCRQDAKTPVSPGTSYMHTVRASQGATQHKLIMRLSHAQYDAVALSLVLNHLSCTYADQLPLPDAPAFSDYLTYQRTRNKERASSDFWGQLLKGASITNLGPQGSRDDKEATIARSRHISVGPLPRGITMATVVKAAWSLILARRTGMCDVLFGQVVHGRNTSFPGIERVVGPCTNITPVRASIAPQWTGLDLLQALQDQHRESMAWETVDLDDVLSYCANWTPGSALQTVVQHQNVVLEDLGLRLGDVPSTVSVRAFDHAPREVWLYSSTDDSHPDRLSLRIFSSSWTLDDTIAEELLGLVAEEIVELLRNPEQVLCV